MPTLRKRTHAQLTNSKNYSQYEDNQEENPKLQQLYRQQQQQYETQLQNNTSNSIPSETHSQIPVTGILEKIQLRNFMCHSNLELELNPCINVITGRNGSGKSAIMTALLVCFGAKAKQTNRSKDLGGLVRAGQPSCVVSVKIRNRGTRSFQYEEYGPSIIIERSITKNGASSYKVKSHNGTIVAKKSKTVKNILDYMGIQINNPCTLMTQDASRQFLTTSSSKDRYRFFMKATLLETVWNNFSQFQETLAAWNQNIKHKREVVLGPYERKLEKLKQNVEIAKKVEYYKQQQEKILQELSWANVADKEDELEEKSKEKEKLQQSKTHYEKQLTKFQQEKEQSTSQNTELNQEVDQLNQEIEELSNQINEIESQDHEFRHKQEIMNVRIRSCDNNIRTKKAEIKKREEAIQEKIDQASGQDEQLKANYEQLKEIKRQIQEKQNEIENIKSEIKEHQEQIQEANNIKVQAEQQFHNVQRQLQQEKNRYQDLQGQKQNHLQVFGRNTTKLLNMIHRSNAFKKPPIGPMGALIQLRDKFWAPCLERCLKNYITAFIVDNHADEKVLQQIFQKANQRPTVFVMSYTDREYDTTGNRPPSDFTTIDDMLHIDRHKLNEFPLNYRYDPGYEVVNATIMNLLRDQYRIENTILIPYRKEAKSVMFRAQRPPPHVSGCYTSDGRHLQLHPSGIEIDSGIEFKKPRIWAADFHSLIAESQQQIQRYQTEFDEAKQEAQNAKRDYQNVRQKNNNVYQQRTKLVKEISELETRRDQVQEQVEQSESNESFNVSFLRNAIKEYEKTIEEEEEKKAQYQSELEELKEKHEKTDTPLQKLKQQRDEKTTRWNQVEKGFSSLIRQIKSAESKITKCEKNIQMANDKIEKVNEDINKIREEHQLLQKKAENFCPERIERQRPTSQIREESSAIEKYSDANNQQIDNRDAKDVIQEYESEKDRLDSYSSTIRQNEADLNTLQSLVQKRKEAIDRQFYVLKARADLCFGRCLSAQNYQGNINIDPEKKTLDFSVSTSASNSGGGAVSDVRTLSGGERSFSTVGFLLALWMIIDLPFRAVDEVDIFMDSVHRSKALDLLLNNAKNNMPDKQLIILTPHDTSSIPANDEKITVLKMADPRPQMRQTTLDS
eukprot:gb/GECH01000506.1/.p1 GENE.gb/GECH01000506.1/~~gb/GECH01000506.1/.p1  ORF type:complete len:1129 (+),score=359.91 gb/GECH01000506.1/:1-3387(+)